MSFVAAHAGTHTSVKSEAMSGARAAGTNVKDGTDFSDALMAILAQMTPQQSAQTQSAGNSANDQGGNPATSTAQDQTSAATDASSPSTAADAQAAADSKATLLQAMQALQGNAANDDDSVSAMPVTPDQAAAKAKLAQIKATQASGTDKGKTETAAKAATQAKLVSALAAAANKKAPITGSDGKTPASSNDGDKPAKAAAQTETTAQMNKVLAAMQAAQPVVTTVAANGNGKVDLTSRTMPQLEKAALSNTAQQAMHNSAPAQKLEAQALPAPLDAKSAKGDDANGQSGNAGSGQSGSHSDAHSAAADTQNSDTQQTPPTADASQSVQPQQQAAPQAPSTDAATAATGVNASTATTASQAAQPTAAIATTLHVSQQADQNLATQPNLAALALSIAAKSKDGQKQFDIRMEPAELGRVDVRLSVDATGKTQAHLTAEKPETLQLLQNDKTTLERTLRDSGLDLSNSGLNFSLKGEQQNASPTFVARSRALSINTVQVADVTAASSGTSIAPGDSRLDIRV